MAEYVPQTEDHVETPTELIKIFRPHCAEFAFSLHGFGGFKKHKFPDGGALGYAPGAGAVACAHVEQ